MTFLIPPRYADIEIRTLQGSPLDETFVIPGEDWSGTYVGQVVTDKEPPELLATLIVTALYNGTNTQFTLYSDAMMLLPGKYHWAVRSSEGWVPARGDFKVLSEGVPLA